MLNVGTFGRNFPILKSKADRESERVWSRKSNMDAIIVTHMCSQNTYFTFQPWLMYLLPCKIPQNECSCSTHYMYFLLHVCFDSLTHLYTVYVCIQLNGSDTWRTVSELFQLCFYLDSLRDAHSRLSKTCVIVLDPLTGICIFFNYYLTNTCKVLYPAKV